jgi:hypothetical protein
MQSVTKIKGTSAGSFTIGLRGATLYQGSTASQVTNPNIGDVFIRTGGTPGVLQYCGVAWTALTPGPQWAEVTAGITAITNYNYLVNTADSAYTILLPYTPELGDRITLMDATSSFATNNLTIDPNGSTIMGQTGKKLLLSDSGITIDLVYYNSTYGWRIVDTSMFSQNYI